MAHPTWPFFDLIVRTPMLELRVPREDELVELVSQGTSAIFDRTGFMPFHLDWTEKPVESMKFMWKTRAEMSPESWRLSLVPFIDGEPLGDQSLRATNFPVVRSFDTGSYLLPQAQGRGIGTEMRAAALHLGFAGLGAIEARSSAHVDNEASNAVSRKLGYEVTHRFSDQFGDTRADSYNLLLRRETWEQNRRDDIEIEGLDACLPLLGLADT